MGLFSCSWLYCLFMNYSGMLMCVIVDVMLRVVRFCRVEFWVFSV